MRRLARYWVEHCCSRAVWGWQAPSLQNQSGLVNVAIGDVTILENVSVGVAANVAAAICGVQVGPVAVLANQAAAGQTVTVCEIGTKKATSRSTSLTNRSTPIERNSDEEKLCE